MKTRNTLVESLENRQLLTVLMETKPAVAARPAVEGQMHWDNHDKGNNELRTDHETVLVEGDAPEEEPVVLKLSGGAKQRVCVARALANTPDLILADEPVSSLSPTDTDALFGILEELQQCGPMGEVVDHLAADVAANNALLANLPLLGALGANEVEEQGPANVTVFVTTFVDLGS